MAFPITNYSRVWVRGKIIDFAKAAREATSYGATGPVQFIPTAEALVDSGTKQIIATTPLVVYPSATDGSFAIQLPATNDPDINPSGWNYKVIEPTGRTYYLTVPYNTANLNSIGDPLHNQPVIELSSVVPDPAANGGVAQLLAGVDGRSITGASINGSNHLILTMSDSTTIDAGAIVAGIDAEGARDAVGNALSGTSGITVTVNDPADTITIGTSAILPTTLTTKGDILVATSSGVVVRQGVGSNGQVLTADSTQTNGVRWAAPSSTYVTDTPAAHGLLEWNYDPVMTGAGAGVAVTSGTIYLQKLTAQTGGTVSNIIVHVGTAGSSLTSGQNLAGIYDDTGARIGVTSDQTTGWGSVGLKTMALTSSASLVAGRDYYVALLSVGTTPASFVRSAATALTAPNAGLSAALARFSTNGTSQTSLPSTRTLSSNNSSTGATYWVALS